MRTLITGILAGAGMGLVAWLLWQTETDQPPPPAPRLTDEAEDPRLWLEEVGGRKALDWVERQNAATLGILEKDPRFPAYHAGAMAILNADDRIPWPSMSGDWIYNLWRDDEHPRGLLRRTRPQDYRRKKPSWETVFDVDAFGKATGKSYVYKGSACLPPAGRHCLLFLSDGGKDAREAFEFDRQTKSMVPGGFYLPAAKSDVAWLDKDTLLVGTDFGPDSLTSSGYPRTIRRWQRGTALADAPTVFTAEKDDVSASVFVVHQAERQRVFFSRSLSFFERKTWLFEQGRLVPLPLPPHGRISGVSDRWLLVLLRRPWAGFPAGSLVGLDLEERSGWERARPLLSKLFVPEGRVSLGRTAVAGSHVFLNLLDNVRSRVQRLTAGPEGWQVRAVELPENGSVSFVSYGERYQQIYLTYSDFLTPTTLYEMDTDSLDKQVLRTLPSRFNSEGLRITQQEAVSSDGTVVPYFLVRKKDADPGEPAPLLLYAYGGFEIPMVPRYMGLTGRLWLEKGGAWALANIRGGGEFGPDWHRAALKENRQKSFDDFFAVASHLIRTGVTTSRHLGIKGGSNGGLLMGAAMTQKPELFQAVICAVPLLDMLRFHKLLAGASWIGEYGNPDIPAEREWIRRYSPYHRLGEKPAYPRTFFITSTRDDRVHPGHARKMAAKMEDLGHPFFYFENTEGGHAASADLKQRAKMTALEYIYLTRALMDKTRS